MNFSLVAAVDKNFGLGKNNSIPWHLSADLNFFADLTTRTSRADTVNAVIMGRRTWKSIPPKHRPLKNRLNVVLSRSGMTNEGGLALVKDQLNFVLSKAAFDDKFAYWARSLDEALEQLDRDNVENIFVIGGGKVYEEAINHPKCHKIFLTQIDTEFDCDTFFPKIDPTRFQLVEEGAVMKEDDLQFQFKIFAR